jgi:serine/threonine protein kinase
VQRETELEQVMAVPSVGDLVAGKYRLVRTLGVGGMGVVFEALHVKLQQRVAIKFMLPRDELLPESTIRFEREACAVARLDGVHVAKVIDVDTLPSGLPYIVLEYLEGHDLGAELAARGPLPVEVAVDYALQAASALADAHASGVIHRDIKPANLFLCDVGLPGRKVVKVLDFGVAKLAGSDAAKDSERDSALGTPEYMSPEHLQSATEADERADVWSLGVVLFELLTGRTPFTGSTISVVAAVSCDEVPRPGQFRDGIPARLEHVILQMLERDPGKRISSMDVVAARLSPFAHTERVSTALTSAPRTASRLGEILVANAIISAEQLESALDEQRRTGELLGKILVDLCFVAPADVMVALTKQRAGGAFRRRPRVDRPTARRRVPFIAVSAAITAAALAVGAAFGNYLATAPAAAHSVNATVGAHGR